MAVKTIKVPFCDRCGLPWLPKMLLKDGTRNPIFDHPDRSKRCGKCKRPGWNAGGVDRRRKIVEPVVEEVPQVTAQDVAQTMDLPEPHLIEVSKMEFPSSPAPRARRCRHGFIKCKECQPEKAA